MPEVQCGIGMGIVIIFINLALIFLKDLMWDLTEWSNRVGGRVSERTPEWEIMTTIAGIVGVVIGTVFIVWVIKSA